MSYEIVKALHIISVIAWMAGLSLSAAAVRLSRRHQHRVGPGGNLQGDGTAPSQGHHDPGDDRQFPVRRLDAGTGTGVLFLESWMQVKIAAVIGMAACHGIFAGMRRKLENDEPPRRARNYRIWNEVPTLLMVVIVVMAVVKPDLW